MPLRVTFLGTAGAIPTTERNPSSIHVSRKGEGLLFDAGEGTQRQMMRFGTGFSVSHLFVTHLHGDHVLGIPGLLQTMAFNDREAALAIHTPRGTRRQLKGLVNALNNRPSFPVRISEVGDGDVAYRAAEFEVRAFDTDHDTNSVGYALVEDDRKGRFDRDRAEELGVPVGPKFSKLHEGEAVELEDGTVVEPEQVVGEPRPGRTIVYTGDTRPTAATVEVADEPDLLIHDATFAADRADRAAKTAHSTARQAAELASRAGADRLALMHLSSRYAGHTGDHLAEAREVFDGETFVPADGDELEIPYPNAPE
ncbi:ribonuclease Z [Natrialba asiatica]|uniref:Ribonuclease Z n=1 Tax=Natrialba asiatica (strain ATCC 700177 / DSM 12278 / JCM 9576 / FERM P-10747 / NBRC 102637 / 172P1) TaxID=29540 RepID=M0AL30_NATA1|nr:ribonuclease Z [Natrialba asiatica]ELY98073.1 ribonuclease Z [Natrialba asiatica DSM 12278]